ncbi:MAG TPA: hypothetical protein VK390_15420, partial [Propionibacteriaceae bacterium]|nr:hypothetical protein [Propionibacteriaceae bacterium]
MGANASSGLRQLRNRLRDDHHIRAKECYEPTDQTNDSSPPVHSAAGETIVKAHLDAGPTGTLVYPGDAGWDRARAAWVINVDLQPAAVAVVRSTGDVSAVVISAARAG